MLKGLVIRQSFVAANVVLIAGLVLVMGTLVREIIRAPLSPGAVSSPHSDQKIGSKSFGGVSGRSAYDGIVKNGLFGRAAAFDNKKPPPPKDEPPAIDPNAIEEETKLPLKLFGTSVSGDNDLLASAVIEVKKGQATTRVFYLGQEVMPQIYLAEVRRKEVVLDNQQSERLELLKLTRPEQPASNRRAVTTRTTRATNAGRPQMITLDRQDIRKRAEEEFAVIASTVDVEVVRDEGGNVTGITTEDIEAIDLATELGFENGDVLTSINNEPVTSAESGASIVRKYQNASIFRIGIVRDGQPQYINYRVR